MSVRVHFHRWFHVNPDLKKFKNFEFENHQSSQIKNPARSKSWFHLWHSYLVSIRLLNVFQGFENLINISKNSIFIKIDHFTFKIFKIFLNLLRQAEIIASDCSWLQPNLTNCSCLKGLQMTSIYKNCLQLLKLIANKCNSFKLKLSTDRNWFELIAIRLNYLNWLQLLKPIASDCNWLQMA